MECSSFSTPVGVLLYAYGAVTYDRPFAVFAPNVPASYATIANGATPTKLIITDFTRLEVTPTTSVGGTTRKVIIEYDVVGSAGERAIEQIKPLLGKDCHTLVSFLNGEKAWVRATENSFSIDYSETEGRVHVTIEADTISGMQRIES